MPACRVTGPVAANGTDPSPCVVLASRAGDAELDCLASQLAKIGIGCLRLTADFVGSARLLADPSAGVLLADGYLLLPTVTWVRHFTGRAIRSNGAHGRDADAHRRDPGEVFLRDSWQAFATQLRAVSRACVPTADPGPLVQLATAARLGVSVPRTVVVSDLRLAKEAIPGPRLVIKAMAGHFVESAPGRLTGVHPEVVDRSYLDLPWRQPAAPVLVQEFVAHDAELRVYFVRGEVYCFTVTKSAPSDPWLDPERVRVAALRPPSAVLRATRKIARALRLDYAALDFLMRGDDPVFLEANQDGDWRWLELRAGTAEVTTAVARMLRDLHRAHAPEAPGGLDVLRFLA